MTASDRINTQASMHPENHGNRSIRSPMVGFVGFVMLLSGCAASLDTAPDMQRASVLISERSGENPQWELPWEQPHSIWDGRSPLVEDAAVRIAIVNNRAIRASLEQIAIARADLVQSGLLPNPILSVALGFPIDGSGGATTMGVGLTQQLVALWLRGDRIAAAELNLDRVILNVSDEALELVKRVRQQHAEIVFAKRTHARLVEQVEVLAQLSELMQRRLQAGEASRLDVRRLAVQQAMLNVAVLEQQQQTHQHKLALLSLMGWSETPIEWDVDDRAESGIWHLLNDLAESDLIERIDSQRLDVLAARAKADGYAASLRLEDRQRLIRGAEAGIGFERDDDRRKEIGPSVSLEVPIFDRNAANVTRAAAIYRQSIIEADRIRQQAIIEVRSLFAECNQLAELIELHKREILPAIEENMSLVQHSLNAGVVDATVLLEAQRDQIESKLRLIELQRTLRLRHHALERALGGSWH